MTTMTNAIMLTGMTDIFGLAVYAIAGGLLLLAGIGVLMELGGGKRKGVMR